MSKVSRRGFLRGAAAAVGTACCSAAFGPLGAKVAWAQSGDFNGNCIITVHLFGGCDWHQSFDIARTSSARAAYENAHPVSAVSPGLILPTSDGYGLHPSLGLGPGGGLHGIYQAGDLRVCRRVGTNDPSRSHDTEQLKFETGDSDNGQLGWMGKVLDRVAEQHQVSRFASIAIGVGNPVAIQGNDVRGLGVSNITGYSLGGAGGNDGRYRQHFVKQLLRSQNYQEAALSSVRESRVKMFDVLDVLQEAADDYPGRGISNDRNADAYPDSQPGPQLRQLAMVRRAGLPMQLGLCGMGGFDMHDNIGNESGRMAERMSVLNQALTAFRNDMVDFGLWNKTVVTVDSEFGRTIQENGSRGTDHGEAMALLVMGGRVNGGVSGRAVTGDEFMRNNGRPNWIEPQFHFANAYKELLAWAGLPRQGVFGPHQSYDFNLL